MKTLVALFTLTVMFALLILALPGEAQEGGSNVHTFSDQAIPNPNRELTARQVFAIDTYDASGEECELTLTSFGTPSTHEGNYVELRMGQQTTLLTLEGSESEPNKAMSATTTVVLGEWISVWNWFTEGTSLEGSLTIDCSITTTTTVPETTTTTEATTTTTEVQETTTTTAPTTTSTTVPVTTSTTVPETTSSTGGPSTSITTTTIPPTTDETLPFTGPEDTTGLAIAGAALLALGGAIIIATREEAA